MKRLDYAAIRQCISLGQVLGLIDYRPGQARGDQWRGLCPICQDASSERSFSANVRKNAFQCFGCRRKGNQLDLWAEITGLPIHHATLDLCEKLTIRPIWIEIPQPANNA